MKNTELRKELIDFYDWITLSVPFKEVKTNDKRIDEYLKSINLALGKQKPKGKNKECNNNFYCWKHENMKDEKHCVKPCGADSICG